MIFAKDQIEWLGHRITQSGITPLSNKAGSIQQLSSPSNLNNLRSFMGSLHPSCKFITNLSQLCHPLRPLSKKNTKSVWTDEHEQHLKIVKTKIAEETKKKQTFQPGS